MTTARHDSKCPGCGEMIREGDDIFRIEDEWACARCKEEA